MRKYYKKGLGCSNFECPRFNQSKLTKPLVDHYELFSSTKSLLYYLHVYFTCKFHNPLYFLFTTAALKENLYFIIYQRHTHKNSPKK